MSARIALPILTLAALAALGSPDPAAAGPWSLAPGEWFSSLEGSMFSAPTFHLNSGFRADTGLIVEQRVLRSYSELGWKKRISIILGVPAMSVTRLDAGHPLGPTATGLQDALLGARFRLTSGRSALALETDWSAPLGYNRGLDSLGLHLGEGVTSRDTFSIDLRAGGIHRDSLERSADGLQELTAGLHLGTAFLGRGFFQASVGYSYRYLAFGERKKGFKDLYDYATDTVTVHLIVPGVLDTAYTAERDRIVGFHPSRGEWADHFVASADLGVWFGPSLLVGGRYRGVMTVANGPLVPKITQHLAGPILLYRVDDGLDMFAGSWSTASGKNVLHFDQFYVGLAFHKTKLNRLQGYLGGKHSP